MRTSEKVNQLTFYPNCRFWWCCPQGSVVLDFDATSDLSKQEHEKHKNHLRHEERKNKKKKLCLRHFHLGALRCRTQMRSVHLQLFSATVSGMTPHLQGKTAHGSLRYCKDQKHAPQVRQNVFLPVTLAECLATSTAGYHSQPCMLPSVKSEVLHEHKHFFFFF